jgi:hypothetical protein
LAVADEELDLVRVYLQELLGDILNFLICPRYFLAAGLQSLRIDVLLEKLSPELKGSIRSYVLQQLISKEVPLIIEDVDDVERGVGLDVAVVLGL